jgi:Transposase IS116/IS110/IS902 family
MARLRLAREQIKEIEQQRLLRLKAPAAAREGSYAAIRLIARVIGIGVETADMLVNEILSRGLRNGKAAARYAGLTGSPGESGRRRREKGLARAGNARACGAGRSNWLGASSGSRKTAPLLNGFAQALRLNTSRRRAAVILCGGNARSRWCSIARALPSPSRRSGGLLPRSPRAAQPSPLASCAADLQAGASATPQSGIMPGACQMAEKPRFPVSSSGLSHQTHHRLRSGRPQTG